MKISVTHNLPKASPPFTLPGGIFRSVAFVFLLVAFTVSALQAQRAILVKGRVLNETRQPVSSASIIVKGTNTGVTSDDNGNFQLNASSTATLVVSSLNFGTQEIEVRGRTSITVSLTGSVNQLDQVVVVGYGTQRRQEVTGSVATVNAATLREVPAPNLVDQLKGRTAGVDIVSNSSAPGASGQIRIRGNRTLTNSQSQADALDAPLIVVDGIPYGGSVNDINPDDVASLDILKDASATAIFGSRGAGGVILITTKRGRTGKATMTFDSYYGVSQVFDKYKVYNGQQYAQLKADATTYNRTSPGTTSYALTAAEQAALAAGVSTDWQDLIYKQGFTSSNQLGLSGGNETTQYGLGIGYYNQTGIIPNQKFERYSIRSTIDHRINKFLKVGLNSINAMEYINNPGGGVASGLARLTPLASPYNTDGTLNLYPAIGSIDATTVVSPLTLITRKAAILNRTRRFSTINSLYGEIQIISGLRYRFNLGLSFRQENGNTYNGPNTWTNSGTAQSASNASVSNSESWSYDMQHLIYYDKTFSKHKIGFTGLVEILKDHNVSSGFNGIGVPADYILNSNLALATSVTANNGSFSESGLLSYMGRFNYAYDNRFLLTATVREDGSSTLSPGHQYFTYPALAVGWNLANEKFMSDLSFISNFKIRGGWGISGNRNVSPYSTLGLLSSGTAYTYNFGTTTAGQQAGVLVTSLPNNSLSWQSTSQTNAGIDFAFFKSRLSGSFDVYDQRTKDILLGVNLPYSNGAGSTFQNLGKTSGKGIEINLSSLNIQSRSGFTWNTDLNFYFNREKITQLTTPTEKSIVGNGWFVGQPLTVIYDVKKIGIWQTADSAKGLIAAQTSPVQYPGQIRVQDVNGDGKIDGNDRQVLGNFQPQWEGGLTNRFAYKGFDLSIVMFARMGMKVVVPYLTADGGSQGFPFFNQGRVNQVVTNYWTRSNPTNDFPAPDAGTDRLNFGSTLGYRDGSFIKCRSINLGYNFSTALMKRTGISSLRVYVNATNPFIIYSPLVKAGLAVDPEGNGYGGAVTGTSYGSSDVGSPVRQISVSLNNPSIRQFTFGVNAKF